MKIELVLGWEDSPKKKIASIFKLKAMGLCFEEYSLRLRHYCSCEISYGMKGLERAREKGGHIWLCHFGKGSRTLSSEDLASKIEKLQGSGLKSCSFVIGPPDGFSSEFIQKLKPNFLWSFGPMTLPHELASVLMAEQLYRAMTILKKEPYHLGHL